MPFTVHTVEVRDGSTGLNNPDKLVVGVQTGVANASGGAGVAVTTAVSFGYTLPPTYAVHVTPNQACLVSVTGKTATGFNVVLTPNVPSTGVIAAGTFDVIVVG
jgi:hypothetical protein